MVKNYSNNRQKTPERPPTSEAFDLQYHYAGVVDRSVKNFDNALANYPVAEATPPTTEVDNPLFSAIRSEVERSYEDA
ncbi:MAG: hypothetical protein WC498_00310 [Candidatus Saccharimonadales bacterium]